MAEAFVYGDSLKDYNVGVIHPLLDQLPKISQTLGIEEADPVKLCENLKINEFILAEMTKQGIHDGLKGFEQAKKIILWPEPFVKVGIVTSTMKLQRYLARQIFKDQINQLYAN